MKPNTAVFNKDTGKFMYFTKNPTGKLKRFKDAGHILVEGQYKNTVMYDLVTNTIVIDPDTLQASKDREDKKLDRINSRKELSKLKGDKTKQQEAIDYIIEILT